MPTTTAKFLSEATRYSVDLPDTFSDTPDLGATVTLDGGAREIGFEPFARRPDPASDPSYTHLYDLTSHGMTASVFRREQTPTYLAAFWRLEARYLYTFMQDELGCGSDLNVGLETVVAHLSVSTSGGLPTVAVTPPVTWGDPRDSRQRDRIAYYGSPDRTGAVVWAIELQRVPSWAQERTWSGNGPTAAQAFVTTSSHIQVMVLGDPAQASQVAATASTVAASVAPH